MGHVSHNAIIVTSFSKIDIDCAVEAAIDCGLRVTDPLKSPVNEYWTCLVLPVGSKVGWPENEQGFRARKRFRDWLRTRRHEDGSSNLEWVEVRYGSSDDYDGDPSRAAGIVDHEWSDDPHGIAKREGKR